MWKGRPYGAAGSPNLPALVTLHGLICSLRTKKTLCSKKFCLSHFEIMILRFSFCKCLLELTELIEQSCVLKLLMLEQA